MPITTLMVHLDANKTNTQALEIAEWLGQHLDAGVIGIAACQPMQIEDGSGYCSGELAVAERDIAETEIKTLKAEFDQLAEYPCRKVEWRSAVTMEPLAAYVANEARSADLLITGLSKNGLLDPARSAGAGDLVMHAGRPVLIVPRVSPKRWFERVVIAWKDTREARRAVNDALPLLKLATEIIVIEIEDRQYLADARSRVEDVVEWLKRHSLPARAEVSASDGDDSKSLASFAKFHQADMIVAGAYGHGQFREWVFGGVTRDLLLHEDRMVFLSH